MIRDITIGQYFGGKSALHRMDPRTKLLWTIGFVVALFWVKTPAGYGIAVLFLVLLYATAKIPVKVVLRSLKPVIPLIVFTAVLNLFLTPGTPFWQWGFLKLTWEGLAFAGTMSVRIVCLLAGTSLLTYTTSPLQLTDGLERLLSPLAYIKVPVRELAMMMTITLRFIPTLVEETDKIMAAQKSRGADMESGNFVQRIKALIPILVPLFISAFRRAGELALAMECRCYQGGARRTHLKVLRFSAVDIWGSLIMLSVCAAMIALNYML